MGKSALDRLSSEDGQLFHLVIGHLQMLSLWICAALPTELVHRILSPIPWSVYFLLNVVMFFVLVFLVVGKYDKAINKLVDITERYVKTPHRLQSGYIWLRKKFRAIESFVSAFFIALIASAIAGGHVPVWGFEVMGNFAMTTLTLTTIYGLFLALLIFTSWIAGLLVGRSRGS